MAMAPDLYRRSAPGLELGHDREGLAQAMAAVAAVEDPATAVCYYHSVIAESLQIADQIQCPVLFRGHAFDNHESPIFSRPQPAARAWELTRDFLARTLG